MTNLIHRLFGREKKPIAAALPEVTTEKLDYFQLTSLLGKLDLKVKINVSYKLPLAGPGQFNDVNSLDLIDFLEREFNRRSIFRYRTEAEHKITLMNNEEQHAISVTKKSLECYIGNQESWRSAGYEANINYVLIKPDLREENMGGGK